MSARRSSPARSPPGASSRFFSSPTGAALIASAKTRRVTFPRAIELLFAAHAPWSLWLVAATIFQTINPDPYIVIGSGVVPMAITAVMLAAFGREVLGLSGREARIRVFAHQAVDDPADRGLHRARHAAVGADHRSAWRMTVARAARTAADWRCGNRGHGARSRARPQPGAGGRSVRARRRLPRARLRRRRRRAAVGARTRGPASRAGRHRRLQPQPAAGGAAREVRTRALRPGAERADHSRGRS